MHLSSLKVQHYKSLDQVEVSFTTNVTVIVGPNGVGKSNFVDALRFLHDAVQDDLEHAVTKREGIIRLLQSYKTKPYKISIQAKFSSAEPAQTLSSQYEIQIKAVGNSDYIVDNEEFSYLAFPILSEVEPKEFKRSSKDDLPPYVLRMGKRFSTDGTLRQNKPGIWGGEVAEHISDWNYCTIYPNTLKALTPPDRESKLDESGRNWASVIKSLKRTVKGKEALERIYEAMRAVIPNFKEVIIQTAGSYLVPFFKFEDDNGKSRTSFDPVQLSDGTLRLFGILLAAYQLPRPKLLVIEEPEQTIYPGALPVLADVFKEIGETTQVLITTHSPHLVQCFQPEQIRVATMHDGLTSIRPIHPHQLQAVKEGLLSLEEFMSSEGLRPDDNAEIAHE